MDDNDNGVGFLEDNDSDDVTVLNPIQATDTKETEDLDNSNKNPKKEAISGAKATAVKEST